MANIVVLYLLGHSWYWQGLGFGSVLDATITRFGKLGPIIRINWTGSVPNAKKESGLHWIGHPLVRGEQGVWRYGKGIRVLRLEI